jgi:hypothetical protein
MVCLIQYGSSLNLGELESGSAAGLTFGFVLISQSGTTRSSIRVGFSYNYSCHGLDKLWKWKCMCLCKYMYACWCPKGGEEAIYTPVRST